MSRKQKDSEKLDQILALTQTINEKVDKQNARLDGLEEELKAVERLVCEMAKRNRTQSLVAGGLAGGVVAVGIELLRLKLGG